MDAACCPHPPRTLFTDWWRPHRRRLRQPQRTQRTAAAINRRAFIMRTSCGTRTGTVGQRFCSVCFDGAMNNWSLYVVVAFVRRRCRYAHTLPAVPSLRGAESVAAVRYDAHHLHHYLHADHLPAMAGPGGRHRGRLPDVHVHLSAAVDAQGTAAGVRVDSGRPERNFARSACMASMAQ